MGRDYRALVLRGLAQAIEEVQARQEPGQTMNREQSAEVLGRWIPTPETDEERAWWEGINRWIFAEAQQWESQP